MITTAPHSGPATSRAAAVAIVPHLPRLESVVCRAVCAAGTTGMTCDEIEQATQLSHQTASARCRALTERGLLEDSGHRRATRSGRKAAVLIATLTGFALSGESL